MNFKLLSDKYNRIAEVYGWSIRTSSCVPELALRVGIVLEVCLYYLAANETYELQARP